MPMIFISYSWGNESYRTATYPTAPSQPPAGLPSFQKFFLLRRRRAFQLGNLVVAFVLQGGAHEFEKLSAGDDTLNIPDGFAEIIGEDAVVSAADVGIGGCLGVFATGEKNMGLGIVRSPDLYPDVLCKK